MSRHSFLSSVAASSWNKGWSSVGVVTLDQMIHYFELPSFAETRSFVGSNDEVVDLRYIGPSESHLVVATASDKVKKKIKRKKEKERD